jgi:altronate dehydratase
MEMLNSTATPAFRGRLLRLAPTDNIAVATAALAAGQAARLDDGEIMLLDDIPLGHKVAIAAIAAGGKVLKYGYPIGSATCPIRAGQHVHVHNLKSDYFQTFTSQHPALAGKEPPA